MEIFFFFFFLLTEDDGMVQTWKGEGLLGHEDMAESDEPQRDNSILSISPFSSVYFINYPHI